MKSFHTTTVLRNGTLSINGYATTIMPREEERDAVFKFCTNVEGDMCEDQVSIMQRSKTTSVMGRCCLQ